MMLLGSRIPAGGLWPQDGNPAPAAHRVGRCRVSELLGPRLEDRQELARPMEGIRDRRTAEKRHGGAQLAVDFCDQHRDRMRRVR